MLCYTFLYYVLFLYSVASAMLSTFNYTGAVMQEETATNQTEATAQLEALLKHVRQEYKIVEKPKAHPMDLAMLGIIKKVADSGLLTTNSNIVNPNSIYVAKEMLEKISPDLTETASQWITKFVTRMVIPEIASVQRMTDTKTGAITNSYYEQINTDKDTAFRLYKHSNGSCTIILLGKGDSAPKADTPKQPEYTLDMDKVFSL